MITTVHAIYENGVLRPTQPIELPERCEVEVQVRPLLGGATGEAVVEFPEEKTIVLSDRDRDLFLQLLESPPPPNAALRKAVSEYRKQYG
ncbi:MAG: antitoxin AF2212-like protein [Thermoguttaceae bacterium]